MPPPYPSSCGKPRPGEKPASYLSAVASPPINKKMARPASTPTNLMAAPKSIARPHQPATPKQQQQSASNKKPAAAGHSSGLFMAPRDAKTVHPARRLAPGTAVFVRTRFKMITEKCWLVIWLPARVVSASDAYHYTVKYSLDLSPAFAGKMARKPVDHVRVVKPDPPRNTMAAVKPEPRDMAAVKPEPRDMAAVKAEPRDMATAPQRKDRFF